MPAALPSGQRPRATRYPLRLTVELPTHGGVTHDISASGILFETSAGHEPPEGPGEVVRLRVLLCDRPGEIPLHLDAEARVVRVERQADRTLIAVATSACGRWWSPTTAAEGPAGIDRAQISPFSSA